MMAVVVLILGLAVLGAVFAVLRFVAALTIIALTSCLLFVLAAYTLSFLGLYFILGSSYIGWAIFGAMGLGSVIVSRAVRFAKGQLCSCVSPRTKFVGVRLTEKT